MTIRALLACMAAGFLYEATHAQPTECYKECDTGYFCVKDTFVCKKCIDCEELKRETLRGAPACIQSVADCGSCFKGLVPDSETGIGCVSPGSDSQQGLPAIVWAAVGVALVLLLLILVAVMMYVLRNTYPSFKILASTRTSVQSPCNNGGVGASVPEAPPPPYNVLYLPVRPSSPSEDTINNGGYVKRAESTRLGAEGRESAGSQAASVFNNPCYVRGAQLNDLPSYNLENENEREPIPHDEDTVESTWTPVAHDDTPSGASRGAASGELTNLLSAARNSTLVRPPNSTSERCSTQDSNNNRSTGESLGEAGGTSNITGTSVTINLMYSAMQNINSIQQHNEVNL